MTADSRPGAGPRARRRGARLRAVLLTALGATSLAVASLAVAGCGTGTGTGPPAASQTYGGLPGYLPKSSLKPDSVLTGTATHPALTTEGDSVRADLAHASVLMTVTGPEVPGEGLPYQTAATTCTWTVRLTGATGPVPIRVRDFSAIDHLGAVYHPALVPGSPAPPAVLRPGRTVTFELRAVMVVGEGLMRWAPGLRHVVASWDFEVEND